MDGCFEEDCLKVLEIDSNHEEATKYLNQINKVDTNAY